jgi:hypothetical protein
MRGLTPVAFCATGPARSQAEGAGMFDFPFSV